jgi:hypothetical protein
MSKSPTKSLVKWEKSDGKKMLKKELWDVNSRRTRWLDGLNRLNGSTGLMGLTGSWGLWLDGLNGSTA